VVIVEEEQGENGPPNEAKKQMTLLQLVQKGGIIGYTIIVLSIVALGLVIDYALSIQKSKLAPPQDVDQLKKYVKEKKFDSLENYHKEHPSFLAQVVSAGIAETKFGYRAMVKAMEDSTEAITARLSRKIEHLNIIANIAPMLGLLGTVIGMLRCFNEISQVSGAIEPRQLAGGIFEALVTTCMGLIVAIPSLYFFAIFRNRVDQFVSETAIIAEDLVGHFKEIPAREPRR
jgi:biopolymer transport protein ExbB